MTPSRRLPSALLGLALPLYAGAQQPASACDSVISRTSLAALAGARIRSVEIATHAPDPFPGMAHVVDNLHVRTRDLTVRRQLLFAAGETVDTMRVAESMRRLRHQKYFTDVWIAGTRCDGGDVDLVVNTRDSWTTEPNVKVGGAGSAQVGVRERNVLGTGREASAYLKADGQRLGVSVALDDPWLFGADRLSGSLRATQYRDGSELAIGVRTRRRSVYDRWNSMAQVTRTTRGTFNESSDAFRRRGALLLGEQRIAASGARVWSLLVGAEAQQAQLVSAVGAPIVGPPRAKRSFAALDAGLARSSASFDTITWLLPGSALVDVPLSVEGELLVGAGPDFVANRGLVHVDAWSGKMWLPTRTLLVTADVWASGFIGDERVEAATTRARLSLHRPARRGVWTFRAATEKLYHPDPDVRALETTDPTIGLIPKEHRLAEAATALTVERTINLRRLTRSWALDGATFAAASFRDDPVDPSPKALNAAVVGIGLRLTPTKVGRGSVRLDIGYPVMRSPALRQRIFFGMTLTPWLEEDRMRDGRRQR